MAVARTMQDTAGRETPTKRLLCIETAWPHLDDAQQEHILALVEALTKKNS